MDFKEVIWILVIYCCFACAVSNETVQLVPRCKALVSNTNLINSGESSEANRYKVLHDFNFPDVTYPTTALESCQPFYFNSNGLDAIVGPFSSDVQSNYRSLLSPNENKIKDVTTKKSIVHDNIQYQMSLSNIIIDNNKNESDNADVLDVVRKLFEKYITKNHIDSELKEILSVLFSDNVKENNSSEINEIGSVIDESIPLLDEIIGSNLTTNKSSEENMTESIEQLIDRLSEPNIMNSVIEELIQLLDKNLDNNLMANKSSEGNKIETVKESPNFNNSDNITTLIDETTNFNISSDIQLELELTKEDIVYLLLNSTTYDVSHSHKSIDGFKDVNTSISKNVEIEHVKNINDIVLIPELISLPEIELNYQNLIYSVSNKEMNIAKPENEQFRSNQTVVYEVVIDPINLNNLTAAENIRDPINTDEISIHIPKEPVVFDVVYRDAYNLEKPVLDIVPSSIPVRLKINIEIVKHDSNDIGDFYKTNMNNEQFAPRIYENNMNLENVSNSIENTEEDLAPEEQITILDEINESDFINALSILLLDSLNNNPLEIVPPEFINAENNSCNLLTEHSAESLNNNLLMNNINVTNNIHNEQTQPVTVSEGTFPIDSNKEQGALEMESNIEKYNTMPLIEILRSAITADQLEDDHKNNITEILIIENFKPNNNKNETLDELDNTSLQNRNTTTTTQDFCSINKACSFENFKEENNTLLFNTTDTDTTWPLVNIFQLKFAPQKLIQATNSKIPFIKKL